MQNIITIDIDSSRVEDPIRIIKPQEMIAAEGNLDDILKKDIYNITTTSLYMASMLSEEDENSLLNNLLEMIKNRQDEIAGEN